LEKLRAQGIPEEILPAKLPMGKKSYTIHHPESAASVQVLHAKFIYYLNTDNDGAPAKAPCVSWSHHGGPKEAWEFVKTVVNWE